MESIESALRQDYPNFEVIVVNDGSTDLGKTAAIANSFGNRIRYFEKVNGGVASALNLAIRNMRGEFFSWLSHDDLYTVQKLSAEYSFLKNAENTNSIVYSNYDVFFDKQRDRTEVRMSGVRSEDFRYWLVTTSMLHGCTLLIPKKAFDDFGFFREDLKTTQDSELWFRLSFSYDFIFLDQSLVHFRVHDYQDSKRHSELALKECNRLYTEFALQLSPQEIERGSKTSIREGQRMIVKSLRNRGWDDAATIVSREFRVDLGKVIWFRKINPKRVFKRTD